MSKVEIVKYKPVTIAVKVSIDNELQANGGKFIETPKVAGMQPCWVFSAKRKPQIEKMAKQLGGEVKDYNPGVSIALVAALPHMEKLRAIGGHMNQYLSDGVNRFVGWSFGQRQLEEVQAVCATF